MQLVNSREDTIALFRAKRAVPWSREMNPLGLHRTAATSCSSHQLLPAGHEAFTSTLNALCIIVSPSDRRPLSRSSPGRTGTRDIYRGNRTQFSRTVGASPPPLGSGKLGGGPPLVKNKFKKGLTS